MVPALVLGLVTVAANAWWAIRRRHRHVAADDTAADLEFDRARSAVDQVKEAIVSESDLDVVVMIAAYHLTQLFDLEDVAWAWRPDPAFAAILDDDATIRVGTSRWSAPRRGLPERTQRALVCGTHHYGWIVMTSRPGHRPVSRPALYGTVALCDQVAACLAIHAHPPIAFTG